MQTNAIKLWIIFTIRTVSLMLLISHAEGRVYTFAFTNDGYPFSYIENGTIVGQSVDMVREICKFAGKECEVVFVQRKQCWNAVDGFPPYSIILNDRWYDACANLPSSKVRGFSYMTSQQPFLNVPKPSLIVHKDSNLTIKDLLKCLDLSLAYPENTGLRPECMRNANYRIRSYLGVTSFSLEHVTLDQINLVVNKTVDLALVITNFFLVQRSICLKSEVKILTEVDCRCEVKNSLGILMRKDDRDLSLWWDDAVRQYICTDPSYSKFCQHLTFLYGFKAACLVPGIDVDCSQYGGASLTTPPLDCSNPNQCLNL